jgi:arylamine N-acetyltransferase
LPDLTLLDALMAAYVRRVPWESASRITRRAQKSATEDCPRFPAEFWETTMRYGSGGTCFESNYAFYALLRTLGYDCYLTINDMLDHRACHTAIIVQLEGEQWIADVGIPLHIPLPLSQQHISQRVGPFHTYSVTPQGNNRFDIERDKHPRPYIFTLKNMPVNESDYRAAVTNDYGENGLFLDKVIITRVIDGDIWRFHNAEGVTLLESFRDSERLEHPLNGNLGDLAGQLAARFAMDETMIRTALLRTSV